MIVLIDDIGFGHSSAFGGPIHMPTLEKLAGDGLKYNRFHTTALCSPTRVALLTGRNHHANNAGAIMEAGDRVPRQHRRPPAERHAARRDPAPERLQHRRLRQVSRDAAVGSLGLRAVRPLADAVRASTSSTASSAARPTSGRRRSSTASTRVETPHDARLSLHRRHDRQGDQLGAAPSNRSRPTSRSTCTSPPARRTRRTTCPRNGSRNTKASSTAAGTSSARKPSPGRRSWASSPRTPSSRRGPKEIPAWDDMNADQKRLFERQMETFAGFAEHTDHEVGRLVDAARKDRRARQHALLLHRRRQRLERRGRPGRHLQRDDGPQRHRRQSRPDDGSHRRLGRPHHLPALRHRLGLGRQHAVPVDQAGRQPLRRHAQRHGHPLAQGHQSQGRSPHPVPPRHRRRADRARSGQDPAAQDGQRHRAAPDGRRVDALLDRRRQGQGSPHHAVLRDVRQPRHLPRRLGRLHAPFDPLADGAAIPPLEGRRLGALQRRRGFQPGQQPRRAESRRSSRSCRPSS